MTEAKVTMEVRSADSATLAGSVSIIDVQGEITSFADAWGNFLAGKPSLTYDTSGFWDPASSQGDATIFGELGLEGEGLLLARIVLLAYLIVLGTVDWLLRSVYQDPTIGQLHQFQDFLLCQTFINDFPYFWGGEHLRHQGQ